MCGGNLEISEGMKICQCSYCRTFQTVPDISSERKLNLFSHAGELRLQCEFDKSSGIYEIITAEFPEEPEAYWGLCLCKYGIEYVDDPKSGTKIPTCHRTCFESILDDKNFRLALKYSDYKLQQIYTKEAEYIDRVQKNILEVARNEKPFDVFICYKESDSMGNRTPDSIIAEKIYKRLTSEGLKVFFARETLKTHLGCEYEPYIFSAINSASVMIVVGTQKNYFNSVWVRNEWSRFLDFMNRDKNKILIPCYDNISVLDIPKEFQGFQAQNFSDSDSFDNISECVLSVEKSDSGYDNIMKQYELQLKSERLKVKDFEDEKHRRASEEKKNAYKLYKKEKLPTGLLIALDFVASFFLMFIVFGIVLTFDADGAILFPAWIISWSAPIYIGFPVVHRQNVKAKENLLKRLSYSKDSPYWQEGSVESNQALFEKHNAKRLYENEYIDLIPFLVLDFIISFFLCTAISESFDYDFEKYILLVWILCFAVLGLVTVLPIRENNRHAEKRYYTRINYDENKKG